MPIQVTCPACSASFQTSDANAGKRGKCPKCSEAILVPGGDEPEVEAKPSRPERPVRRSTRTSARSSRRELGNVEDLPADALPPAAVGAAVGVAVLGAAVWAFIAYKFNYEIGWVAWGIGALVGTAAVRLGGRGVAMGATAAGLTLLGIAGGKYSTIEITKTNAVEMAVAEGTARGAYSEIVRDAKNFAKLPEDASDEAIANFMETHDYTDPEDPIPGPEDVEFFREYSAPFLQEFHASPPEYEAWSSANEAQIRAEAPLLMPSTKDIFLGSLGGMDLLFAALGIATAWGLVTKASG